MNNLYSLALYATVILGTVVVVLSAYAVLTRWQSDRRQTRAAQLRPRMHEAVEAFLDGRALISEAERELDADPRLGLGILFGVASVRSREEQMRLRPLAERMDFQAQALHALTRRNPALRARAAVQLGYLGNEAAVPALLAALHDEQLDVRLGAAQALVQMRHAAAVGPILHALALPGRWPLQRATELLYGFGPPAVQPLRQLLADRDRLLAPAMQAVALNVLGMLGAREAAPEVLGWLEHAEPELRVAAVRALGGMADPSTGAALARALRDDAWEVRSMAAKALGQLRQRSAIAALDAALADPVWWVRYNAAQALAELGADGLDALRRAMTTQDDAFARDISRQMLEERNPRAQEVTP